MASATSWKRSYLNASAPAEMKRGRVFSNYQQRWLPLSEVVVEGWVERHIIRVVKEEIQLNIHVARAAHRRGIWRIALR
jgi:hypothetical protein